MHWTIQAISDKAEIYLKLLSKKGNYNTQEASKKK